MKEPVDHILRPRLRWRTDEGAITECGLNAASVKTLSRDEFTARLKEMGQQRTAVLTCMTCSDTAQRWSDWDTDPRSALQREIDWEHRGRWSRDDGRQRLAFELRAIAWLIETHREAFDQEVARLHGVSAWQHQKKDHQTKRHARQTRRRI